MVFPLSFGISCLAPEGQAELVGLDLMGLLVSLDGIAGVPGTAVTPVSNAPATGVMWLGRKGVKQGCP